MTQGLSSEVWKGIHQNFSSPKEREEFHARKRQADAELDTMEARQQAQEYETTRRLQDGLSEELEPLVHHQLKTGAIITPNQRRHSFSSLPT